MAMSNNSAPPAPKSASEARRVEHSRLRRRILYDLHQSDVEDRLVKSVGTTRARATRIIDMSTNPARYVFSQLSCQYRETPEVGPPEGAEGTAEVVAESGFWQLAQRVQRDALALNDVLVRVDLTDGMPSFRLCPPDLIEIVTSPVRPSQPLAVNEWLPDPDDPARWVQVQTDPRSRTYRVVADDLITDVTERVLGAPSFSGDRYPFIIEGKPVLPYVAYHAAESGYGLDPYTGRDLWEGSLQLSVYYSFAGHALRQSSWAQRWLSGGRPVGGTVSNGVEEIISDPAALLVFESDDSGGQVVTGQWGAPVDVDRLYACLERYERRLVESALSTVGVSRRDSDIRSAQSLAVSREAQRDAQRSYEPVFRRSDLQLLKLIAGLRGEPTEGWTIRYRSIPRDSSELAAELDRVIKQVQAGLLDPVSAYQSLHPGLTDQEAEAAVALIASRKNNIFNPQRGE